MEACHTGTCNVCSTCGHCSPEHRPVISRYSVAPTNQTSCHTDPELRSRILHGVRSARRNRQCGIDRGLKPPGPLNLDCDLESMVSCL